VAALEGGEWAKARASAQSAEAMHYKVERARELRTAIIAAGTALAGTAEEVAWIDQGLEARHPDRIARYQPVGVASETAGTARHA
jgi:hypothetical protein